jgi:nucleoside-diphosphate-sugar epimerase
MEEEPRSSRSSVLLLGGTGRTGRHVLEQLLGRGVEVRSIVRSPDKLPAAVASDPKLTLVTADLPSLGADELTEHVRGSRAVISCLGHVTDLRGVFGPPRDLVTHATTGVCEAIGALQPEQPIRFILMSSVSVNDPRGPDTRRGTGERVALAGLRALVPPARDNQRAADFLRAQVGTDAPFIEWVVVRPDTLLEGDVSRYSLHPGLVSSLRKPDSTTMANVGHFMCELATEKSTWQQWRGRMPVITDATGPEGRHHGATP